MLRNFFDLIIRYFLKFDFVNRIVLHKLDLQIIREYLGKDFLSPIQGFALDGYNDLLYQNLNITSDGIVVVLGGYLGDSASSYNKSFGCQVHVYEPIKDFYKVLKSRFIDLSKVHIESYAVSSYSGIILLSIDGEKTGQFGGSTANVEVETKDISEIIEKLGIVDLLESNIEGGEYEVLFKLIETGQISKIKVFQIQFHNYGIQNEIDRSKIRLELGKTHNLIFNYEWVWERWELKN